MGSPNVGRILAIKILEQVLLFSREIVEVVHSIHLEIFFTIDHGETT